MQYRSSSRTGFSLLEAMISAAILMMSLVILIQTQTQAVQMHLRAQRIAVATQLAQEKMSEVTLLVETDGVGTGDIHERGDFNDLGEDSDLEFGDSLEDYRWEYWIEEVDVALAGDVATMAQDLQAAGLVDGGGDNAASSGGMGDPGSMMSALGFGPEQLSERLNEYIRVVRIRVYWTDGRSGFDARDASEEAEEDHREVLVTSHIISAKGAFRAFGDGTDQVKP